MSRKKKQIPDWDTTGITSTSSGKEKKKKSGLSLFGIYIENINPSQVKRHLLYLIILAILTIIIVICVTTLFLTILTGTPFIHYYDSFDFRYYLKAAYNILQQGQIPYAEFGFDYPPFVFIPIFIALIPGILFNNEEIFIYSFQLLMVICNIVIIICIYLIGLKLYNEKTAFIAAGLYATAFSVAYFILIKYDAFPTCILMLAVLFTVYSRNIIGYIALVGGFLAKIFPVIAVPFTVLYNAKSTSIRQEILYILKIWIPVAVVCLVPILILKPGILASYFSGSLVRTNVNVNTVTYTLYVYLHDILNLGISVTTVSTLMYILMGLILLFLVAFAYIEPKKDTRFLIKLLALSIFVVIFCMKYHSPQYVVWFTPFVCLLVADSIYGIVIFYMTQVITYIEFPLAFGTLYLNENYLGVSGTTLWYLTLVFFTINFVAYFLLMYLAVKPTGSHAHMLIGKIREKLAKKS